MSKSRFVSKIASERIERLFELALSASKNNDKKLGGKYIRIARDISSHYKVTIPKRMKRRICKNCGELQIPGLNSKVIIASSKHAIIYKCKNCGAENKIFYRKPTSHVASRARR